MTQAEIRNYAIRARSTDVFGRVLCNVRNHHFVVDGPVQNGAPGEEVTPTELFRSGIAACGVELSSNRLQRLSRFRCACVNVDVSGTLDRSNPLRKDVSVFNSVRLQFELKGVTQPQGTLLIDKFKGR